MSAALCDSGVDTATILIDMVRIRPIPLDFTKCAVGVTVLAAFDLYCFLAEAPPRAKSGNGVRGHLWGAGQITHAPGQCTVPSAIRNPAPISLAHCGPCEHRNVF